MILQVSTSWLLGLLLACIREMRSGAGRTIKSGWCGSRCKSPSPSSGGIYPSEPHLELHGAKDKIPLDVLPFGGDVQPGVNLRETSRTMRSRLETKGGNSGKPPITE